MLNLRVIGWMVLATSTLFGVVGCDDKADVAAQPRGQAIGDAVSEWRRAIEWRNAV